MVISKIIGGLGNQLFCYAFAKTLSDELNQELKLDLSFYTKNEILDIYRLNRFCIYENTATKDEINNYSRKEINKYLNKIFKALTGRYFFLNNKYHVDEKSFSYDKSKIKHRKHLYITGYWAQPELFQHNRHKLLKYYKLNVPLNNENKTILESIKTSDSIAVHIRRGDYINNNYFVTLPKEYYLKAIELMKKKFCKPYFYFFSDDIDWVINEFSHIHNSYFVNINDRKNDFMEFELMRNCHHFILANSTFSWWAAWLSEEPSKNIIIPGKWFNNMSRQLKFENSGLIQDKWTVLWK